jgi:predicted O-methyltransferase YrrM
MQTMATTCFDHLTDAIASAYDFSAFSTLVDVGGNQGALLMTILAAYPGLRGVLFDQPHVVAGAGSAVEAAGVADRCEVVGGDLLKSLPSGGAAYLLNGILCDWDDEHALAILTNCRRAMGQRGTLLLVERVLPAGDALPASPGGHERTAAEYRTLLAAIGFTLARIIPVGDDHSIVEGLALKGTH